MAVSYIEPAERAWARTRRLLFRPVDVERWIVIGFSAFLAGLAGQWAGITAAPRWGFGFPPDWDDLGEAPFVHLLDLVRGSRLRVTVTGWAWSPGKVRSFFPIVC